MRRHVCGAADAHGEGQGNVTAVATLCDGQAEQWCGAATLGLLSGAAAASNVWPARSRSHSSGDLATAARTSRAARQGLLAARQGSGARAVTTTRQQLRRREGPAERQSCSAALVAARGLQQHSRSKRHIGREGRVVSGTGARGDRVLNAEPTEDVLSTNFKA